MIAQANAIIADYLPRGLRLTLRQLTGRRYGLQRFAERPLALLLANWPAVEAIAAAILRDHTIDGGEIEKLVFSSDGDA